MAEFVGLRTRLKPGMEDRYEAAHKAVPPELLAAHRELGIKRWLIFRDGLDLFHSIECDDYDRAIAELAKKRSPILHRLCSTPGSRLVLGADPSACAPNAFEVTAHRRFGCFPVADADRIDDRPVIIDRRCLHPLAADGQLTALQ